MRGLPFRPWLLLTLTWTLSAADTNITCLIMETCILPCSFQRGDNPIVHWIKDNEGTPFLSYYNANPQFRNVKGRGFLFSDQVSKGNASLRLSWVQLHDQGRYTCYVTTRKNERYTYVNVNVQAAPVLDSSEGISREREPVRSTEPTTASRTLNAAITPRWSTQPFPNKGGYHGPTTENVDADRDRTAATPERDDGATKEAEGERGRRSLSRGNAWPAKQTGCAEPRIRFSQRLRSSKSAWRRWTTLSSAARKGSTRNPS
ncbi:uncharacterized protein LOC144996203 [Oryzias latipes]